MFSITGKANLERTDLEPALKALKERLMTKNVVCVYTVRHFICLDLVMCLTWASAFHSQAEEIAGKLCESVEASLEGKKLASFTRISSTVQVLCFFLVALIESRKHFTLQYQNGLIVVIHMTLGSNGGCSGSYIDSETLH